MLYKVSELSQEKKSEFLSLINGYKSNKHTMQGIMYVCHQDHLMGWNAHSDWDSMNATRNQTLPDFEFHEYVSMKDGKILGAFYYTVHKETKIGYDFWVNRFSQEMDYVFSKDWLKVQNMYIEDCKVCHYYAIYSDAMLNYEQTYGARYLERIGSQGKTDLDVVQCRDGQYREVIRCVMDGKLK